MNLTDAQYNSRHPWIVGARFTQSVCSFLAVLFAVLGYPGAVIGPLVAAAHDHGTANGGVVVLAIVAGLVATTATVVLFAALAYALRYLGALHRHQYGDEESAAPPLSPPVSPVDGTPACPTCHTPVTAQDEWSRWECATCHAPLMAVECDACGRAYVTVWTNWSRCRRCRADWETHVHQITYEELRSKVSASGHA